MWLLFTINHMCLSYMNWCKLLTGMKKKKTLINLANLPELILAIKSTIKQTQADKCHTIHQYSDFVNVMLNAAAQVYIAATISTHPLCTRQYAITSEVYSYSNPAFPFLPLSPPLIHQSAHSLALQNLCQSNKTWSQLYYPYITT
jgi:hypothetical protein